MRRYPTNREFVKQIRHNNKTYTLRSIFDTSNRFDFDAAVAKYNPFDNSYSFDKAVSKVYHNKFNVCDTINDYFSDFDIEYDPEF